MKFSLVIPIAPGRKAEILESIKKIKFKKKEFEIIPEYGTNASENRNNGADKASGDFLVFLDDDAEINEDYLKRIEKFFENFQDAEIVGGPQLTPKTGENFFAKVSGAVLSSNFGAFKVNKRYTKSSKVYEAGQTDLTSANLCVKKSSFEKIGGFNKELFPGEDPEFINRAKKNNLKVYYNPDMIVYHKRRAELSKYVSQIFKYGLTRPMINKISGTSSIVFLIPLVFLIYFSLLPFLSLTNILFILPFFMYVLLAIIFAVYDSIKNGILFGLFYLPFLYLFTHLSYGAGLLLGYIRR